MSTRGSVVCPCFLTLFMAFWLLPLADAQSQASCTFKLFELNSSNPSNPGTSPNGVNDFDTIVGQAISPGGSTIVGKGFIRFSGGGIDYYSPSGAIQTVLYARNNNGVSVGDYTDSSLHVHAFSLEGSTATAIVEPKAAAHSTMVRGINKSNTVVGSYTDTAGKEHGFERTSSGSFSNLNFPNGSQATNPNAINDSGAVVGSYTAANGSLNGFMFHNGSYATLDFPKTTGTELFDISNAGLIIGLDHSTETGRAFMYVNGTFKVIAVPNSFSTEATGIAPGGLITGWTNLNGTSNGMRGFTATCH